MTGLHFHAPRLALALWLVGSACAEEPTKPAFAVSTTSLGGAGGTLEAADFAAALAGNGDCAATVAPRTPRWNVRPPAVPAAAWVSIVIAGFGERAHAFAFMFDGPDGSPRLLAHVPYGLSYSSGGKVWWPPTARLTATFLDGYRRPRSDAKRPLVTMSVAEWKEGAEAENDRTAAAPSGGMDALIPMQTATSISVADGLPALEAMLCAALCENGLAPTWAPAAERVRLDTRFGFHTVALRLRRESGAQKNLLRREDVPEERCADMLSRLLYVLDATHGVHDVALLGVGPVQLVSATPERLAARTNGHPIVYSPDTGLRLWPVDKEAPAAIDPPPAEFAARATGGGEDWRKIVPAGWQGDVLCDGERIIGFAGDGEKLVAASVADGRILWQQPVGDVLLRPPVLLARRILAVGKNARIMLLNAADGSVVKETTWPTWLLDALPISLGDHPRLACSDIAGGMALLDGESLAPLQTWHLPARLSSGLVFAPEFPVTWAAAAGADEEMQGMMASARAPAILAGDIEGFCYILALDEL
jgi:hypothetical protein